MDLLAIADTWSHWARPPKKSISRNVTLPTSLSNKLALVVQGVRRSGKSTLMAQLMARYELDRKRCLFVNFEDPRLSGMLHYETLDGFVKAFEARHPKEQTYYFFDEIQLVDGWQKWLRNQLDRPKKRAFVVSGSSAKLLSGELGATLTGRHLTVELFPFSWEEFCGKKPKTNLLDYLTLGGFPEPLESPDGDALLRQYFLDIVERDMRERVGARSALPLRQLVQMVYESAGSELSVRRIAASLGVSPDTAGIYLEAAVSAYLLFDCPYFDWSARKRAARNSKYYPIDTGLRRVAVTRTSTDRGKMLECATFLALRRTFDSVYYWRGVRPEQGEVDFVIERSGELTPVQVSWDGPTERHHRALDHFYEAHPQAKEALFVTSETFGSLPFGHD